MALAAAEPAAGSDRGPADAGSARAPVRRRSGHRGSGSAVAGCGTGTGGTGSGGHGGSGRRRRLRLGRRGRRRGRLQLRRRLRSTAVYRGRLVLGRLLRGRLLTTVSSPPSRHHCLVRGGIDVRGRGNFGFAGVGIRDAASAVAGRAPASTSARSSGVAALPPPLAHHLERPERCRVGPRRPDEVDPIDRQGDSQRHEDTDEHDDGDHRRRQQGRRTARTGGRTARSSQVPSTTCRHRAHSTGTLVRAAVAGTIVGVFALVWFDVVGLIGIIAACGGLYYLSSRIEPHWVSKDQSRFLTVAQDLDQHGVPIGRRRDVRVHIDDESDALIVSRRSLLRPNSGGVDGQVEIGGEPRPQRLRAAAGFAEPRRRLARRCASRNAARSSRVSMRYSSSPATKRRCDRERAQYRAEHGMPSDATGASGTPGSPPPDPPTDRD